MASEYVGFFLAFFYIKIALKPYICELLSSIKEIIDLTKDMRNDQGNSFQSHFDLYWSPSTDCIF